MPFASSYRFQAKPRLHPVNQTRLDYAIHRRRYFIDFIEDIDGLADAIATKETLVDTEDRIGMILDLLPVGLIIHQPQGILFANQAACDFLGCSSDAIIGQHILDHLTDQQATDFAPYLQQVFSSSGVVKRKNIIIQPHGQPRKIMTITIAKLPWDGTPVLQILMQDMTLEVQRENQMQKMMATDTLTGSQNRRSFIQYIKQLKENKSSLPCGVLIWDIDFFKNINDTFGHQAGDLALQHLVLECEHILARWALIEQPDLPRPMLARFGGEEFAVILPRASFDETQACCEAIRSSIANHTITTKKFSFSATVSIGMVMGDIAVDNIDLLLSMADKALYVAKENGRDQIVLAQTTMRRPPKGRRISRETGRKPAKRKIH